MQTHYVEKYTVELSLLDWPPHRPDLNIVKVLWDPFEQAAKIQKKEEL